MPEWTKGQQDFIDQRTRQLMVSWADQCILNDHITDYGPKGPGAYNPYIEYAQRRGWLSKRDSTKLTGSGFKVAASFLRR
jgi:hypothetical protein